MHARSRLFWSGLINWYRVTLGFFVCVVDAVVVGVGGWILVVLVVSADSEEDDVGSAIR